MLTIDLTGRSALVTGSSSGLGEAIAHAGAQAGAHVAVHDRTQSAACEAVAAALHATGAEAQAFSADISRREEVDQLFSARILVRRRRYPHQQRGVDGARANCVDSDPAPWEHTLVRNRKVIGSLPTGDDDLTPKKRRVSPPFTMALIVQAACAYCCLAARAAAISSGP